MALLFELRPARRIQRQLLRPSDDVVEGRVIDVGHAWPAYVRGVVWVMAGLLLWFVLYVADAGEAAIVPVCLVLARGGWLLLQTYEDRFVVTDMRIMRIQGVLNQRTAAMSLSRIVDFTMEQPFFGQLSSSRFGHLVFENAAQDQGLREIKYVPHVVQLNKIVQNRVFEAGGGPAKHKRPPPPRRPADDMDKTGEIPRVT
jgi:hypothetical protein